MTWHSQYITDPASPLHCVQALHQAGERNFVLLHSTLRAPHSGRYSYLAALPQDIRTLRHLSELTPYLAHDTDALEHSWFGYLGYGLKDGLEQLRADTPDKSASLVSDWPHAWLMRPSCVMQWDHETSQCIMHGEDAARQRMHSIIQEASPLPTTPLTVTVRASNMDKARYVAAVEDILSSIRAGTLYQANLTRKFMGEIQTAAHKEAAIYQLFQSLCKASPAPYSSLLVMDGRYVISSSPEQFLNISANGLMESRPIKGTAGRAPNAHEDEHIRKSLEHSMKDKAENLMIVDLMRHDMSRVCKPGTVNVEKLHEVTSYETVHHMASTISGELRDELGAIDAISGCFPPGSMTGAPKIMAMNQCSALEKLPRGVYSGAIGWLGGDGSADLSVVIRTICLELSEKSLRWEFQVGGGIVADSQPEAEWQETLHKARGICSALGISTDEIAAL